RKKSVCLVNKFSAPCNFGFYWTFGGGRHVLEEIYISLSRANCPIYPLKIRGSKTSVESLKCAQGKTRFILSGSERALILTFRIYLKASKPAIFKTISQYTDKTAVFFKNISSENKPQQAAVCRCTLPATIPSTTHQYPTAQNVRRKSFDFIPAITKNAG
ncbi:MAG: hypothetical protein NC252_09870, partial [Roseburia sp.]|nr:hypothetical protein [Roseburia sp.]MCM1421344.1 hypothetical protein [Bacteroides sp.]